MTNLLLQFTSWKALYVLLVGLEWNSVVALELCVAMITSFCVTKRSIAHIRVPVGSSMRNTKASLNYCPLEMVDLDAYQKLAEITDKTLQVNEPS